MALKQCVSMAEFSLSRWAARVPRSNSWYLFLFCAMKEQWGRAITGRGKRGRGELFGAPKWVMVPIMRKCNRGVHPRKTM